MSDFVFNAAKGKAAYYATLPGTNDGLVAVPIEATGVEADTALQDYADLGSLLAGASNEQTTLGRKALASVTSTVDNTADEAVADCADITWAATAGNATAKLIICYDPDVSTGTDADLIPLVGLDMAMTPDGSDFTAQINAAGFYSAS